MARLDFFVLGRRFISSYSNLLKKYPIRVQAAQTSFLVGTGDIIAQTIIEKKMVKNIDWSRTIPYAGVGLVIGPTVGSWYKLLDKFLGSGGLKIVLKKLVCDQLLFAPVFCAFAVYTFSSIRGQPFKEIKENLQHKYIDILLTNYKIWPLVQIVNFYFVPLIYRVLVVQAVAVIWNTYLSWKINSKISSDDSENVNVISQKDDSRIK
uniref:Mitochondrial inner membrane protein Mpv17 n=1 Tax=Clastoptera arizonana TaxID=38151 RepID=A0A1B6DMK9_9HEMI